MPAEAEPLGSRRWPVALALVLLLGLLLRLMVLFAYQRDYPLQQDFFVYFDLAQHWLRGQGPTLGFLYNYLHFPAAILHVEDYYEPFYSLLVAGFMALGGGSFFASLLLPLGASTLTIALGWLATQRLTGSRDAASLAAGLICLHPLMIERASWLMKEALIGSLYLGLWLWLLRQQQLTNRSALWLGLFVAGIGTVQYESMPILGATTLAWLLGERRWRPALIFALSCGGLLAGYWLWFYLRSGLPVSTKYLFLLTPYSGVPFAAPRHLSGASMLAKLLAPGLYIYRSTLSFVGLPLLLLAGYGLWRLRQLAATRWLLWLLPIYLYIHGVAIDLWFQDYLALLLLLIPYAAAAVLSALAAPLSRRAMAMLLLPLMYGLSFWLLNRFELSDKILDFGRYHSRMLIPLALSLLLLIPLAPRLASLATRPALSHALGKALALLLAVLLVLDFMRLKPMPELFVQPNENIYASYRAFGGFIAQELPPGAALIGFDPFSSTFFTGHPNLMLAPAPMLARYRPAFAAGIEEAELRANGYRPRLFRRYAGQPIWRLD